MNQLFVFGTLKEGFRNHPVNRGIRTPGVFETVQPYPLYIVGERRLPWLLDRPGQGLPVRGEVYTVSDAALQAMDALERVQDPGWYERRVVTLRPLAEPAHAMTHRDCWVYFGSEAGFTVAQVHAGPLAEYTLADAARHARQTQGKRNP